ncbi:hypothetical protein BABINDRAFT_163627 [Babjeviella inositovora NRRL Y-12698]|uniref:DNA repair protein REV1 n=1 Tax=Babjeviella inositovora NRRL Y-12698 TaxID=984486 RepID=A0A1E3QI54_9ASCO|nr:uncharacterized protein BABINDRAFT_163627 [Babjeviella inositovora NRRL Y-12698]ODQ77376.1 hypothetical protein BABINDRAFT_163627 [Babjeviella inositovora NRRL Y-12698]
MSQSNSSFGRMSFPTSLGDDELIEYLNRLEQEESQLGIQLDLHGANHRDPSAVKVEDNLHRLPRKIHNPLPGEANEGVSRDTIESLQGTGVPGNISQGTHTLSATDADGDGFQGIDILPPSSPMEVSISALARESVIRASPLHQVASNDSSQLNRLRHANANPIKPNEPKFGDYRSYFTDKHLAQQQQDKDYLEWEQQRYLGGSEVPKEFPPLFKDCVVYVNGYTKPGIAEIHRLVILYGGKFRHYLGSKGAPTHIIASRLTPRKMIEFQRYKVVRPEWITESIEKGVLQFWKQYTVINIEYGQQQIGFTRQANESLNEANPFIGEEVHEMSTNPRLSDICQSSLKDRTPAVNHEESLSGKPQEVQLVDEWRGNSRTELTLKSFNVETLHLSKEVLPEKESDTNKNILKTDGSPSLKDVAEMEPSHLQIMDDELELSPLTRPPAFQLQEDRITSEHVMDAKHPEFLKHYFANSRLHHLSTWRADLRAKFIEKVLNFSRSIPPAKTASKVILHIDFDCFFAAVSALGQPQLLRSDPVCVTHGGQTSDVASCNYAAREFGVKNGMWLKRAQVLCPNIVALDYDFPNYERVSGVLYDILLSLGARSVFPVSVDEALVDASNLVTSDPVVLMADATAKLAQTIRDRVFTETGCHVSVGAASNVLLAKLCLRRAKPAGQFVLLPDADGVEEFLSEVDVGQLPGIGSKITQKLTVMLRTDKCSLGELRRVTRERLTATFGIKTGTKLFEYARGIDATSIDIAENPEEYTRKSVSVDVNYGIRFDAIQEVDVFMARLAQEMHERLAKLHLAGHHLTLRLAQRAKDAPVTTPKFLGLGKCEFISKLSKLGVPTNEPGILSAECKALYRMIGISTVDLRGVAVTITRLVDSRGMIKDNQSKLVFDKTNTTMGKPDLHFAKNRALVVPPDRSSGKALRTDDQTQYQIPSEIDSSVLEELPSSIRRSILAATSNTNAPSIDYGIDWSVYEALPPEIKLELDGELECHGLRRLSPHTQYDSPSESDYRQVLPNISEAQPPVIHVEPPVNSALPRKRKRITRDFPVQKVRTEGLTPEMDEDVFNELPSFIREEILRDVAEARKLRSRRDVVMEANLPKLVVQSSDYISLQAPPTFQNLSCTAEIGALLTSWISDTVGQLIFPHVKDMEIFLQYFRKLLQQRKLTRCLNLYLLVKENVNALQRFGGSCEQAEQTIILEWQGCVLQLKLLLDAYCRPRGLSY